VERRLCVPSCVRLSAPATVANGERIDLQIAASLAAVAGASARCRRGGVCLPKKKCMRSRAVGGFTLTLTQPAAELSVKTSPDILRRDYHSPRALVKTTSVCGGGGGGDGAAGAGKRVGPLPDWGASCWKRRFQPAIDPKDALLSSSME